jgi:hypothetical protein
MTYRVTATVRRSNHRVSRIVHADNKAQARRDYGDAVRQQAVCTDPCGGGATTVAVERAS